MCGYSLSPFAVWALRTGSKNLRIYGPIFWAVLAIWIMVITSRPFVHPIYSVLGLAVLGTVILGFIPPGQKE
jgi:hypothetical protein